MRILHLSNKPVFPAVDGGCKAMQRTLECFLENDYTIKHLCISTEKHPFDPNAYPDYIKGPETIFISTKLNPFQATYHLLKGRSYHLSRFESKELEIRLTQLLLQDKFDVIFLESLYAATSIEVIRKNSKAKVVLRTHNVEFVLWERIAVQSSNPLKKWYISKLSDQLKKEEISILNKVDSIATLSEDDRKIFRNLGVKTRIDLIPIALPEVNTKTDYSSTSFFHLGSMNWKPNREAVQQLINHIFPKILAELPQAQLKIAGSFMSEFSMEKLPKNTEIIGFVDDSDLFYREQGIFLCPIHSGSGVRIKILEAMNVGSPIITTKMGAEGLISDAPVIIAEDEQEFVQSAIDLYRNEERREELGKKSKQFIRTNYSIQAIAKKINDFLRSI